MVTYQICSVYFTHDKQTCYWMHSCCEEPRKCIFSIYAAMVEMKIVPHVWAAVYNVEIFPVTPTLDSVTWLRIYHRYQHHIKWTQWAAKCNVYSTESNNCDIDVKQYLEEAPTKLNMLNGYLNTMSRHEIRTLFNKVNHWQAVLSFQTKLLLDKCKLLSASSPYRRGTSVPYWQPSPNIMWKQCTLMSKLLNSTRAVPRAQVSCRAQIIFTSRILTFLFRDGHSKCLLLVHHWVSSKQPFYYINLTFDLPPT